MPIGAVGRSPPLGAPAALPLLALALLLAPLLTGCAGPFGVGGAAPDIAVPYRKAEGGYPSLAPLVRVVTPAVVNVSVEAEVAVEDYPFYRDRDFRRFMKKFDLPIPRPGEKQQRQSVGSGLIVDPARGYVLTNGHVIEDSRDITVTLKDRGSFKAVLVGRDPVSDLAILRIPPVAVQRLAFANSDRLEVGDFVLAIGNPFGIGQSVTSGIVSALERNGGAEDGLGDLIQTDASINPGNSGGPLVNLAGEVVGISTALIGPSGGNVGIGFAVPSNVARGAMNRVIGQL
jgi:S1-C subfamily serine protease